MDLKNFNLTTSTQDKIRLLNAAGFRPVPYTDGQTGEGSWYVLFPGEQAYQTVPGAVNECGWHPDADQAANSALITVIFPAVAECFAIEADDMAAAPFESLHQLFCAANFQGAFEAIRSTTLIH